MAGALLARAGVRVLVLESHGDFLRDFRGDTVHPSTMDVIGELGWLDDFLARPHQELRRLRARIEDEELTLADFSRVTASRPFVALMPQWDFLDFVTGKARAFPGFELWMKAKATGLVERSGRVVGVRGEREGRYFEIESDLVIAADGRRSILRDRAGLTVRDIGAPMDVLWFRLPRSESDPSDTLGWVTRGRFLVFIQRGDYWQMGALVRKGGFDSIQERGIDAFRADLVDAAPFLGDRAAQIRTFDDVKLLEVKVDRLERWWRPGLLCIGDAAHAMSPIGGVGINLAIQDAVAAANRLAEPLRRHTLVDADLEDVQHRRELPTRVTQALQVLIQKRVIERVLGRSRRVRPGLALRAVSRWKTLQRIPAHLLGIGIRPEHVETL
jgi:2-polyprenyl-6-methoxyphenol hydroxylase-like FAD-dependent oxidoreductase